MKIFINGKEFHFDKRADLSSLVDEIKIDSTHGIAIAINGHVIPRAEWEKTGLNEEDKIILIKATAGG